MSLLKDLFVKKARTQTYDDFWSWFTGRADAFHQVVKSRKNIEENFFNKMAPRLKDLKEGFWFLTGMYNEKTAELILTAEGNIGQIAFVEELVAAAPEIPGWRFTALKPALRIEDVNIQMGDYTFSADNLYFYPNEFPEYPDEVDIRVCHKAGTDDNKNVIANGIHVFLDHYLGELCFATDVDEVKVVTWKDARDKELVPIAKLRDYLTWRKKEFLEKYDGIRYTTENDEHSILEAETENGERFIASVNTELLQWDSKASHPWQCILTIHYNGKNNKGMPEKADAEMMKTIEDTLKESLKAMDGYLHVVRRTGKNERVIYFACKDFREPSKVYYKVQQRYKGQYEITYDIYKDKYWQTYNRFQKTLV